jgi:hypothetical protein
MTRLGRNPFESKPVPKKEKKVSEVLSETLPQTLIEKIARFFYVDIPAESFLFSLKAVLLVKSAWD